MAHNLRQRNQAWWRFVALPFIFLTVALLGGLRIGVEKENFIFVAPPLVCLILAAMLMILFLRGKLIVFPEWISSDLPLISNLASGLTLLTLFIASAQALNSVLPERGLLFWLFAFFFLWTLWNNLFSEFEARKLLRSLAVLFSTAFLLKHLLLAAFATGDAAQKTFWQKFSALLLESLEVPSLAAIIGVSNFAPLTGYLSFFTLCLYVVGLIGLLPRFEEKRAAAQPNNNTRRATKTLSTEIARLAPHEQQVLYEQLLRQQLGREAVIDVPEQN